MRRVTRKVWTERSDSTANFVPFVRGSLTRSASMKVDFQLSAEESDISVQPAVRYSADGGATWDTPTTFGGAQGAPGWYRNNFADLDVTKGPTYEIGFSAVNASGSALHLASITSEITETETLRRGYPSGEGTDNHVPRWDGTSDLQDSSVSIDDSGNLIGPAGWTLQTTSGDATLASGADLNLAPGDNLYLVPGQGKVVRVVDGGANSFLTIESDGYGQATWATENLSQATHEVSGSWGVNAGVVSLSSDAQVTVQSGSLDINLDSGRSILVGAASGQDINFLEGGGAVLTFDGSSNQWSTAFQWLYDVGGSGRAIYARNNYGGTSESAYTMRIINSYSGSVRCLKLGMPWASESSTRRFIEFEYHDGSSDSQIVGYIRATGASIGFSYLSDARLKKDIQRAPTSGRGREIVAGLEPSAFRKKHAPADSPLTTGWVAQHLLEVYPDAVDVPVAAEEPAKSGDSPEQMYSISETALIIPLVECAKELDAVSRIQQARLLALEAEIAALRARVDALELA